MIDEVKQSGVGKVQVLEDHHDRVLIGESLEEGAPRTKELLRINTRLEAEQGQQRALDRPSLVLVGNEVRRRRRDLGSSLLLVIRFTKSRSLADHLAERPEGDALAVGRAAAVVPQDRFLQPVDVLQEFPRQTRFAYASRADDADQPRPALAIRRVKQLLQQAHLVFAADEWRFQLLAAVSPATFGHDAHRSPCRDRGGLALERLVRLALERDRVVRRTLCRLADENGAWLGRRLQSARGVHQVPGHHALAGSPDSHSRLSRKNARARLDARPELRYGAYKVEGRPHCAFRVVLLGSRGAPHCHHGIADELLYVAAITADHLTRQLEVARQGLAHLLRILALGEGREADEVREQDADQPELGHRCFGGRR